jgi:hypothetical protein
MAVQLLAFLAFISGHQLFLAATRLTPFPFFFFFFFFFLQTEIWQLLVSSQSKFEYRDERFEIMCKNTIGAAPAQNLSRHYYALLLLRNTDISRTGNTDNGDISQHQYKKVR